MEMEIDKQTGGKVKTRPDNLDPTGRLPGFARPISYKLVIAIVESHFEGTCTIGIDILSPTDSIVLHADSIEIFSTDVEFEDDEEKTVKCEVKHYQQYAELRFGEVIGPGRIFVTMDYAGLYDHLNQAGFCYRNYSESLSQFWTRFEPTYARRAFPCFDEPHFKAVFSISIETNANYFVYSNTDVENETLYSIGDQRAIKNNTKVERKLVEFAVTPPLSTAYVGWFITTRVFTAKVTFKCKVRFEFIGYVNYKETEEIIDNIRCIERVFNYIYYYFGLRLEMYCLRYIEIPAMAEVSLSWGLGFFPAAYISSQVQPLDKSWMDKKQFFMLKMAPHVAKLWVGIYSTVQFWNEVWLQEGITHFVKFAFANSLNLSLMDEALERREAAMLYDGMVDARALAFKVEDSNYVEDCFDEVILNKGFIVVRLLWLLAAEDIFSFTLINLLNRRKFKNFTSTEFIKSFRNMTSPKFKPALDDFHKWIDQAGVPQILLAVYDRNVYEGHRTRCKFEQSRFYHIPRFVDPYIKPEFSFYLDYKELIPQKLWNLYINCTRIHIEILNNYKKNYFVNTSWNGYHLTKQHKNSLRVLHWFYDNNYLSTEAIYNHMNDAIFMAFANQQGYNVSMSYLFKFLILSRKHSKFLIWRVVDAAFQKMDDVLIHAEQHVRNNLKLAIYRIMVSCRPPECLPLNRDMFHLFIGRLFKIDEKEAIKRISESPNLANTIKMPLRQIVRKLIVHNYAEKVQPIIMQHPEFKRERKRQDAAVVKKYIYALSQKDLGSTIEKIEYVLCHEHYHSHYYIPLIKSISDTVDGQRYLSNFIHQNYKVVWDNVGARTFKKIFPYFVNMAVTEEDASRVENLFEKHFTPEMQQVMRYTVQEIAETIRLNKRIFDSTSAFFEKELHDPYYEKIVAIRVAAGCAPDGTGGTGPHPDVITIKYKYL